MNEPIHTDSHKTAIDAFLKHFNLKEGDSFYLSKSLVKKHTGIEILTSGTYRAETNFSLTVEEVETMTGKEEVFIRDGEGWFLSPELLNVIVEASTKSEYRILYPVRGIEMWFISHFNLWDDVEETMKEDDIKYKDWVSFTVTMELGVNQVYQIVFNSHDDKYDIVHKDNPMIKVHSGKLFEWIERENKRDDSFKDIGVNPVIILQKPEPNQEINKELIDSEIEKLIDQLCNKYQYCREEVLSVAIDLLNDMMALELTGKHPEIERQESKLKGVLIEKEVEVKEGDESIKGIDENEFSKAFNKEFNIEQEEVESDTDEIYKPPHYLKNMFETIDEMVIIFGKESVIEFCICNAWKYKSRALYKSNIENDLKKADQYMYKALELKRELQNYDLLSLNGFDTEEEIKVKDLESKGLSRCGIEKGMCKYCEYTIPSDCDKYGYSVADELPY